MTLPTEQQQPESRQENLLDLFLSSLDELPLTPYTSMRTPVLDAPRPWTAEERNDMALEQDDPLRQDLTGFISQDPFLSLFDEIESSQDVAQAIQNWPPAQKSGVHVDYNANDERPIQIQGNDSIPQSSESQGQPGSRQENLFVPVFTDSNELSYTYYTLESRVFDAARSWTAEERNDMALENDSTFIQTPVLDATRSWTAEERNDMVLENDNTSMQTPVLDPIPSLTAQSDKTLENDNPLSQDRTGFNFLHQFQFQFDESAYSQPASNSQVPSRLLIPPSGAAGPTTSPTTTVSSAPSPGHAAKDDLRTVGSPRIQQAAAKRRKKDGIYQCLFDNCTATFTEGHNLQYHINSHLGLKPYGCAQAGCTYAAASPATLKRHSERHSERHSKRHRKVQVKPKRVGVQRLQQRLLQGARRYL